MNEGSERLVTIFQTPIPGPPRNASDLARHLKVSRQAVFQWLTGEKRPSVERRKELQHIYGIPEAAWV